MRKRSSSSHSWKLICFVLVFLTLPAVAQLYTGSIAGTVTDPSGAVVAGAHVTATDMDKGFAFPGTTDNAGRYLLRNIPPGRYSVAVEVPSFQKARKDGVTVTVDLNVSVDFVLKVGAASQTVEVQATGVELQTQDATTGQVVDRKFINDLPLISRDFTNLSYLAPGVTVVDTQCQGCTTQNFISNGSRNSTADILLDGVSSSNFEQNSGILASTYTPSVDSVEEFKVQQSNFSAEYGFSGATVVNVVTRSGTNQFHGSFYEFFRNQALDANNWFNNLYSNPRPGLQRNNFGATIGGPIKKNKAFFFFDYEGTRENDGVSSQASVPTANMRNGDFGEVCTLRQIDPQTGNIVVGHFDNTTGACLQPDGTPWMNGQLYDPYSADTSASVPLRSTIIPFNNLGTYHSPGNPALNGTPYQVPSTGPAGTPWAGLPNGNLIDPVAYKLIQMFPQQTSALQAYQAFNWYTSGSNHSRNDQIDAKVDYRFSDANLLSVKYSEQWNPYQSFNCFKNEADPCTSGPTDTTAHLVAINDTHTFSPTIVLNVSYGLTRGWTFTHGITGYYPNLDPVADLGLPAYFDVSGYKQFPAVTIGGYPSAASNNIGTQTFIYLKEGQETHQLLGSLSWVRGAHEFKVGADFRMHRINFRQPGWPGGQGGVDFTSSSQNIGVDNNGNTLPYTGGDGMASFLMGIGTMSGTGNIGGTYEVPNVVSTQSFQIGGFIQDNYRFNAKLTLNLGMRYELNLPRTERYNRMNWLDPNLVSPLNGGSISFTDPITNQPVTRQLLGGEVFASPADRYNYDVDYTNWQPRFGLAYQLPHSFVLRGGYGIYFSTPRSGASGTGPWGFQGYDEQTGWTPSFNGADILPGARFSDPFPGTGPLLPPGNSLGALNDVGFAAAGPIKSVSKNTPYEQAWSFGFQKELPGKIIAEANYVGKKGTHLYWGGFREQDHLPASVIEPLIAAGNTAQIQILATNPVTNPFNPTCNVSTPIISNPLSPLSGCTVPEYYLEMPYLQFTNFAGDSPPIANSIYHAVQFRAEKEFSNGLEFLMTYVVSKSIDDSSTTDDSVSWLGGGLNGNTLAVQDPNNLKPERSESTWDIPQLFQVSYVYSLPIGRGRAFGAGMNKVLNAFVGGWQTNGIIRIDTGRPIIPALGVPNPTVPTYGQRPNLTGKLTRSGYSLESDIQNPNSSQPPNSYFANPEALSLPPGYTLGSAPRTITSVRQPGARAVTLSMFKEFPLSRVREGARLEFRLEAFNAFNHPYFNGPDAAVGSPTYGQITSTADSQRQVQMALKFYW
jgi:hypothetical protein